MDIFFQFLFPKVGAMDEPAPPTDLKGGIEQTKHDHSNSTLNDTLTKTPPKETEQIEIDIHELTGDIKQFTGTKQINWDKSVTNGNDQITIQTIGSYIAIPREETPEEIKRNIEATASRIRERGGLIMEDDLIELNKIEKKQVKKTIGIISIITNPLMLFYYTLNNKKPIWRLLRFTNTGAVCLEILENKMSIALKVLGLEKFRDFKHSLIGFSTSSPPGIKLRNNFIYSVGPSITPNTNPTPQLERSISPIPRTVTPQRQRCVNAPQTPPLKPNISPRFQLTPMRICKELPNPRDLASIKIKNLMPPNKSPVSPRINIDIPTSLIKKLDTEWKQTTLDLGKGVTLCLKYKIQITSQDGREVAEDTNKNVILDTPKVITPEVQKPTEKKPNKEIKQSQEKTKSQPEQQKEKPLPETITQANNPTSNTNEQKVTPNKPKEIQIYKNQPKFTPINPLATTNKTFKLETAPPRKISTMLLRDFVETFTIRVVK